MTLYTRCCVLNMLSNDTWEVKARDGSLLGSAEVSFDNFNGIIVKPDVDKVYQKEVVSCLINYTFSNSDPLCCTDNQLEQKLHWLDKRYRKCKLHKRYKVIDTEDYYYRCPTYYDYIKATSFLSKEASDKLRTYLSDMAKRIVVDKNYFGWVVSTGHGAVGVVEFQVYGTAATLLYDLDRRLSRQELITILKLAIDNIQKNTSVIKIEARGNVKFLRELGFVSSNQSDLMIFHTDNSRLLDLQLRTLLGITNTLERGKS